VRGYQTDVLNRNITVAVPVPAHRIRELEPDCDLLDFDPECEWSEVLRDDSAAPELLEYSILHEHPILRIYREIRHVLSTQLDGWVNMTSCI
jgi:hypothetical protein